MAIGRPSITGTFVNVLYIILLYLAVFDGLRNSSTFFDAVNFLKDLFAWAIFCVCLTNVKLTANPGSLRVWRKFVPYMLVLLVGLVPTIYFYDVAGARVTEHSGPFLGITVWYRHMMFFVYMFCFYRYEKVTGRQVSSLLGHFVVCCLIFIAVNMMGYFSFLNFLFNAKKSWYGRIGIGYPTMDAQTLCFGLAVVLFTKTLKGLTRNIVIIALLTGIGAMVTATGAVTALFLIVLHGFAARGRGAVLKAALSVLILVGIAGGFVYVQSLNSSSDIVQLAQKKMQTFSGGNSNSDLSVESRQQQFSSTFKNLTQDSLTLAFGKGTRLAFDNENEYAFIVIAFGIFGIVGYVLTLLFLLLDSFRSSSHLRWFYFSSVCIYVMSGTSLTSGALAALEVVSALVFAAVGLTWSHELKERDASGRSENILASPRSRRLRSA